MDDRKPLPPVSAEAKAARAPRPPEELVELLRAREAVLAAANVVAKLEDATVAVTFESPFRGGGYIRYELPRGGISDASIGAYMRSIK